MKSFKLTYKQFGESGILIEWPQKIDAIILDNIRVFTKKIIDLNYKEILELNFVYNSLLVIFDNELTTYNKIKEELYFLYKEKRNSGLLPSTLWHIPVCYDTDLGVDLEYLSKDKGLSVEQIISTHSDAIYTVYGIGFLPGFLYLGGLKKRLYTPRRNTPRLKVPKGAIAIGGEQTGIYPQDSPGGWHIIGNSPISVFNPKNNKPCFVTPGDKIKFKSISKGEYEVLKIALEAGVYELKSEQL